ncbi:MAG: MCE family protein [Nitriliruptorales bacterium]
MTSRLRLVAVLGALALLASACASINPFASGGMELTAHFPTSYNLFEGSVVRVAGVDVGEVTHIDVPEGSSTVVVTLRITRDVQIPADARAVIIPQALIGERYLQLEPAYTGGPTLESGAVIPVERTAVPAEFDRVMKSLNDFLKELPEEEVARLVTNLATVLDGRGEDLGAVLDNAEQAIDALRDSDAELVRLAARLSDLNEGLAPRNEQIGAFIASLNTVATSLADDRELIDGALDGLLRMTDELGDLLVDHRSALEQDIAALTSLGRTASRNVDQIDRLLFWQAELFRGAERVVDREKNWLPLVQHFQDLSVVIADRLADRVVGVCARLGIADCEEAVLGMPDAVCLEPVVPCAGGAEDATPLPEALDEASELIPDLLPRLQEEQERDAGSLDAPGVPGPNLLLRGRVR